ncbi:hypothetical protein HGM15179_020253, partial [Zosterops borbonicus]
MTLGVYCVMCLSPTQDHHVIKTNLSSLLNTGDNSVTADGEKAEVFNAFFVSIFNGKMACPQANCPLGRVDGVRESNCHPVIQEEAVREVLSCLDVHKSMGPDGIHPMVMRQLADELAKLLSIIYQQSWITGEVPHDWMLANVTPIYKKGRKEDPGNYSPVSLTSVPGKDHHVIKTNLSSLLNTGDNSVTADGEKAEVFNAFFVSIFNGKMACPQANCPLGRVDGVRESNCHPVIQEEAVREVLSCLDVHKSMGPDGIHPMVMRQLADELAKLLSIIYQQSWITGEVPHDWMLANVTPIYKKGRKEDPGNYSPVSLTSVP